MEFELTQDFKELDLETLSQKSRAGDQESTYYLALRYVLMRNTQGFEDEGIDLLEKLSEQGDARATYQLGLMELKNSRNPLALERAKQYLHAAAAQDYDPAKYALAEHYQKYWTAIDQTREKEQALRKELGPKGDAYKWDFLLARATFWRDPEAAMELAEAYRLGDGVKPDPAQALRWYHVAASEAPDKIDRAYAYFRCGTYYAMGEGTPQDYFTAFQMFSFAESDNRDACYNLGILYKAGLGTEKNTKKGNELLEYAGDPSKRILGVPEEALDRASHPEKYLNEQEQLAYDIKYRWDAFARAYPELDAKETQLKKVTHYLDENPTFRQIGSDGFLQGAGWNLIPLAAALLGVLKQEWSPKFLIIATLVYAASFIFNCILLEDSLFRNNKILVWLVPILCAVVYYTRLLPILPVLASLVCIVYCLYHSFRVGRCERAEEKHKVLFRECYDKMSALEDENRQKYLDLYGEEP